MRIILTIALSILAGAAVAQAPPLPPLPPECSYQPCDVVVDMKTGQTLINGGEMTAGYTRISAGPNALSLEETAISYFRDVAQFAARNPSEDQTFHPKNMLRDRDGLTEAQAREVIAVALQTAAPMTAQARQAALAEGKARMKTQCEALNRAATPDAQLAALQAAEADETKRSSQEGQSLLAQLSPATRAQLMKALVEYRKSITVGRQDWKKIRDTQPEALEMYRARACSNVSTN